MVKITKYSQKEKLIEYLSHEPKSRTIAVIVYLNENYGTRFPDSGSHYDLLDLLEEHAIRHELYKAIVHVFSSRFKRTVDEPISFLSSAKNEDAEDNKDDQPVEYEFGDDSE